MSFSSGSIPAFPSPATFVAPSRNTKRPKVYVRADRPISAWLIHMAECKQRARLMRKGHQALMRSARPELAAGFKFWRAEYQATPASRLGDGNDESPIAACLKKCLPGA